MHWIFLLWLCLVSILLHFPYGSRTHQTRAFLQPFRFYTMCSSIICCSWVWAICYHNWWSCTKLLQAKLYIFVLNCVARQLSVLTVHSVFTGFMPISVGESLPQDLLSSIFVFDLHIAEIPGNSQYLLFFFFLSWLLLCVTGGLQITPVSPQIRPYCAEKISLFRLACDPNLLCNITINPIL